MLQILSDTPSWVYVLFIVLLCMGIKRCFPTEVKIKKLIILPVVFFILNIKNIVLLDQVTSIGITNWIAGGLCGGFLGYLQARRVGITVDKDNQLIRIPGNILTLISIMIIFFVEFYIHYIMAISSSTAQLAIFKLSIVFIGGLILGVSSGRNMTYLMKYFRASNN